MSFLTLREGPLRSAFVDAEIKAATGHRGFDLYVANTVLSVRTALRLSPSAERVVAWIHESQRFLEMSGNSAKKLRLHKLKYAAFPANFQMEQFRPCMPKTKFFILRNCVKKFSFDETCTPAPYFVVVGYWEENKKSKTDHRSCAAAEYRGKFCFRWRRPTAGRQRIYNFQFLGRLLNEKSRKIISQSKGLLSASLSEVQNISAIEAALCRRPLLLSDIHGHRELQSLIPGVRLYNLSDPESFAAGLAAMEAQMADEALRDNLQVCAAQYFSERIFMQSLEQVTTALSVQQAKKRSWLARLCRRAS